MILDGWGYREATEDNAIANANTPTWDQLLKNHPNTLIGTAGADVGLPDGQMGNSEVGHMSLGTGRIIYQTISRINQAIEQQKLATIPAYQTAFNAVKNQGSLHIIGLLSPGGVHSHQDHLFAMIESAAASSVNNIIVHVILDGRDTPPQSAQAYLTKLNAICEQYQATIGSVIGRFYAMDRDHRWDRIETAFKLIAFAKAPYQSASALEALSQAYQRNENDEFVQATVIGEYTGIENADAMILMNFRADRARELTQAFVGKDFNGFNRNTPPQLSQFVMTTDYTDNVDALCAFPPLTHNDSLGEYLAKQGKTQLRIAETEKYAHVTFFFSGGREALYDLEERVLVDSPKVETYDMQPEMSTPEVTEKLVAVITSNQFDCIICNIANGDMVGHTGNYKAAIKACEAVDACLKEVTTAILENGGDCLITADHGNCEQMLDYTNNQPHTQHTVGSVPLVYVGKQQITFSHPGRLCDVAPSLLALMGLPQPEAMTGVSLIKKG